jgi:hypothetical protein
VLGIVDGWIDDPDSECVHADADDRADVEFERRER